MRILLINPPLSTSLPTKGVYPMGLGYLGAMLRENQCDVDVFDIRLNQYDRAYVTDFLKKNQEKYGVFGIGCMVTAYQYVKWLSQEIRKYNPGATIIVGGSICTVGALLLKKSEVDAICIGEGEKVIVDIVRAVRSNTGFANINNLIFKDGEDIIRTKTESPIEIDSIPFPAWELFDMNQYTKNSYLVPTDKRSITMIAGRGCPYGCTFCYRNFGRKMRHRNVNKVTEEIKMAIDRFGIGHIDFLDEIFNANTKQVKALCNNIIQEGIKITWRCIARTDLVDKETLEIMYKAGCRWIGYGIESGSQEMLDRMDKRQRIENIEKSIMLSREVGLIVTGTFIIGMPGETEKTIQESRDFFRRNKIFNIPFYPVPYPGTVLYDEAKKKGLIKNKEEYVSSLEKDATNLTINLTELPDSKLIEQRNSLIKEFESFIPSLKLPEKEDEPALERMLSQVINRVRGVIGKR